MSVFMKVSIGIALIFAAKSSLASTPVPSVLTVKGCEFGEIYAGPPAVCDVSVSNTGDKKIRIFEFKAANTTGSISPDESTIAPHATVYLRLAADTDQSAGHVRYVFKFKSNEHGVTKHSVDARGYVLSALDEFRPMLDLDVVDLTVAAQKRAVTLHSHEVADFRITKVLESPSWLDAAVGDDGRTLEVTAKSNAPFGLHNGFVKVALNTPRQKEAMVEIKADIHGDVVPSANPVDMGLMRVGGHNEFLVRLNSRSNKKIKVGKTTLEDMKGTIKTLSCMPVSDDCQMLRIAVAKDQPTGSIKGKVIVDLLDDSAKQIEITLWGLLVPKDFKVKNLDASDTTSGAMSEAAKLAPDLAQELKSVVNKSHAVEEIPPGNGPLLKWSVSNGASIYGFQIFRADAESGPSVLMNAAPVRSITEGNEAVSYQWRDNSAQSGKTYLYSIGILRKNGKKEPLAGPQKIVAK